MKRSLTALAALSLVIPSAAYALQTDSRGKQFEKGKAGENGKSFEKGKGSGFTQGTRGECERALSRANARDEARCEDVDGDGDFEIVPNDPAQ